MATRTYKSEPMAAAHEMMEGLHQGGAIDEQTMHDFDTACLFLPNKPERDAKQRGSIRLRNTRR